MLMNAWQLIFWEKYQLVVNYKPVKCFFTFVVPGYLILLLNPLTYSSEKCQSGDKIKV